MDRHLAIKPSFEASFLTCNPGLAQGFGCWLFYEAMLFGATQSWWGDSGPRARAHEGVDFSRYCDTSGRSRRLPHGTRIPAILDGRVVSIAEDFLGQSLFVRHGLDDGKGRRLYAFYGHILPSASCFPGAWLKAGEVVGIIADPQAREKSIPPHLHLSIAWVPDTIPSDRLDWKSLVTEKEILFLDPLKVLHLRYEVIPWEKAP